MIKPYLDFYKEHGPELVSRTFGELATFKCQREALFLTIGIPPGLIGGRSVLEFGPGTGHNSLFTDSLLPDRYVLVDGSEEVLNVAERRLNSNKSGAIQRVFLVSLFEDFQTDEQFDMVIAEGCIPNQIDPPELFRQMCGYVKPGGVMIFTTVSAASWLSEIVRRLVKIEIANDAQTLEEIVGILEKKLNNHFSALPGMAREPSDWILDNLCQPLFDGRLFSITDALKNLPSDFTVIGTSPNFFQNWNWYKDIDTNRNIDLLNESYWSNVINFVDRRIIHPPHDMRFGVEIEELSETVWADIRDVEAGRTNLRKNIFSNLERLKELFHDLSSGTELALDEALRWIEQGVPERSLSHFPNWWGRGQQHVGIYRSKSELP